MSWAWLQMSELLRLNVVSHMCTSVFPNLALNLISLGASGVVTQGQ
jgi:hypothetical protein